MTNTEIFNKIAKNTIRLARFATHEKIWSTLPLLTEVVATQAGVLTGKATGSNDEIYEVKLSLGERSRVSWECTCDAAKNDKAAPCKHALALAWRFQHRGLEDKGLEKALEKAPFGSHLAFKARFVRETEKSMLLKVWKDHTKTVVGEYWFPKSRTEVAQGNWYLVPHFITEDKSISGTPIWRLANGERIK